MQQKAVSPNGHGGAGMIGRAGYEAGTSPWLPTRWPLGTAVNLGGKSGTNGDQGAANLQFNLPPLPLLHCTALPPIAPSLPLPLQSAAIPSFCHW
jgi:hypothetical protein